MPPGSHLESPPAVVYGYIWIGTLFTSVAALAQRDIVVIGGSAGALEPLMTVLGGLPADFPATILVVLHTTPTARSNLARVLRRKTPLRIADAVDGGPLSPGTVIVARPDHHLMIEPEKTRLTRGPRENRNRPAIDPLFRSAALFYGPRVIGVILSGMLDDGTAGLWAIKDRGGMAVVQSPVDAAFSMMPESAARSVDVDHVAEASGIADILLSLVRESLPEKGEAAVRKVLEIETAIAMEANALRAGSMDLGERSPYSCPECHGVLTQIQEGTLTRFRCHTGHAYSIESLLASLTGSVEEALWSAVRGMEERLFLLSHIAGRAREGREESLPQVEKDIEVVKQRLETVRRLALAKAVAG